MRSAIAAVLLLTVLGPSACTKERTTTNDAPPAERKNQPGAATIVGTYAETTEGAMFTHCATGARYPIAREGDFEVLARAYASVPHDAGAPVVVSLVGRLQPLPVVEGSPPRDQLIVDRVLRLWPDETCEKAGVHTTLDNTYWKLVELNGKPVTTHDDQREVHLILRAEGNRVEGFGGCFSFAGKFEHAGATLHFIGLGSARRPCPYFEDEHAFLEMLQRVTNYQSLGESLDLRDDAHSIARLRAVYFK